MLQNQEKISKAALQQFISDLNSRILKADKKLRNHWVQEMIQHEFPPILIYSGVEDDSRIKLRVMWLFSELGLMGKDYLFPYLSELLELINPETDFQKAATFANYWLICGIPEQDEGKAFDMLLNWYSSSDSGASLRQRAYKNLERLIKKYPELNNEIIDIHQNYESE